MSVDRFMGMKITTSDLLDDLEIEEFPVTWLYPASPIIKWLSRWIHVSPWVGKEGIHYERVPKVYLVNENELIVSNQCYYNLRFSTMTGVYHTCLS